MVEVTRFFEFDYGHRVLGHGGKCRHLHGHRGKVEVSLQTYSLDTLGMVIDFSEIKRRIGGWLDDNLDHNFLAHSDDPILLCDSNLFQGKNPYIMPNGNPTAENIVALLLVTFQSLFKGSSFIVTRVRFWETPNCYAEIKGNE